MCVFFFFSAFSATLASRDTLPVIQFKEKDFQNGAGAKCCGGEEGVCEECVEMCAYKVSAGRNIETAEPVIIISHPLTSLPNV